MEKGIGFKRTAAITLFCFCLIVSYCVSGQESTRNPQEEIRTVVEEYLKKIDQPGHDTWKVKRDSAFPDNTLPLIFLPGSLLLSYSLAEIKPVTQETRDFKQINAQNEPFSDYQRIERDSRHYQNILVYLETLYRNLLSKDQAGYLSLLQWPNLISGIQAEKFVHKTEVTQYEQTRQDVLRNLMEMTRYIYSETDFLKSFSQVTTLQQKIQEKFEELQVLEVDEKAIEQQSGVYLAYELYDTYRSDPPQMESVLGMDYRLLKGTGAWQFQVYDVVCNVTINTHPQSRALRLEDDQWIIRVVRFDSENVRSGWKIWTVMANQKGDTQHIDL